MKEQIDLSLLRWLERMERLKSGKNSKRIPKGCNGVRGRSRRKMRWDEQKELKSERRDRNISE